jgi:integrase
MTTTPEDEFRVWNKGKLIGQKPPLQPRHVWAIRTRLQPQGYAMARATVRQKKTGRPVRFELTEQTRQSIDDYLASIRKGPDDYLFGGRRGIEHCLTTRQYAPLVSIWIGSIGLDPSLFGTHSLRRTKATLVCRRTGNLRAVQLLLGHTKIESTVRYLGVEVDDALAISEQVDV